MAEVQNVEQKDILFALGRGYNGFYCPESGFHLIGVVRPQGYWPKGFPLTDDAKRALAGGTIVDVNKVLTEEDIKFRIHGSTPTSSADRKKIQQIQAEEVIAEQGEEPVAVDKEKNVLSEPDIDTATKKELDAFMKENEITLEGVNSRTKLEDLQEALKVHFGYKEAAK